MLLTRAAGEGDRRTAGPVVEGAHGAFLGMTLKARLEAEIAEGGPISVAAFMSRCLHDPVDGYYATRPRLGADGDFITAPHVSQMFGELLGLWAVDVWGRLGSPSEFSLVEIGPGDGTMMSDVLRAARVAPAFLEACRVGLIETSEPLRSLQARTLADAPVPFRQFGWTQIPKTIPLIALSNEFLDCMPIYQFVRTDRGWMERRVGLDVSGNLAIGLVPTVFRWKDPQWEEAPVGVVFEVSHDLMGHGALLGSIINGRTGAALFIDYGHATSTFGDTLQAITGHQKESPLENPGAADITAHVDFPAFLRAARSIVMMSDETMRVETSPIRTQGDFLRSIGIEARAAALARANPAKASVIARQVDRLIAPDQMGELFKVACIHSAGLEPPGFEAP